MAFRYYAESIDGSGRWQIVCQNLNTGQCSIIGTNLLEQYAMELAEKLQSSSGNGELYAAGIDITPHK